MTTFKFDDVKFKVEFSGILAKAKDPEAILLGAGREVRNQLRKHFRARDKDSPNALSERRSHFWLQIMQSVNQPQVENPTTVSITISDPRFAQKVFGGTIHAKNAGALTIPVEEKAYGRTANTFEAETGLKLFLVKIGGGNSNALENAVLAVADPTSPNHITVEYILTKSVTQSADTEALPQKSLLEKAAISRSQKMLDRQIAGGNPETS
jgi:hypothetical protein